MEKIFVSILTKQTMFLHVSDNSKQINFFCTESCRGVPLFLVGGVQLFYFAYNFSTLTWIELSPEAILRSRRDLQ